MESTRINLKNPQGDYLLSSTYELTESNDIVPLVKNCWSKWGLGRGICKYTFFYRQLDFPSQPGVANERLKVA